MITKQQQKIVDILSATVESLPWKLDHIGGSLVTKTCNYVITVDNPGHYENGRPNIWNTLRIMPREGDGGSFSITVSSYLEESVDLRDQLKIMYEKALVVAYEKDERVAEVIKEISG